MEAGVDDVAQDMETLIDGLVIRPLRADDADGLRDLFFRLSAHSVYMRFFQPVREPSEPFLHHLADVDHHDREALAAVDDEKIVGVARFDRSAEDPSRAEIAILVEDAWQGRGLGKALLRLLTRRAADEGIETFTASVLGENQRMLALTRNLTRPRRTTIDHGEWNLEIPVGVTAA